MRREPKDGWKVGSNPTKPIIIKQVNKMAEKQIDINSEEYIKEFFPRLDFLIEGGNICTLKTDDGRWVLCEIWRFPERRETDPDNEYEIYPFAMFMNDEELAGLKLEGQTPTKD